MKKTLSPLLMVTHDLKDLWDVMSQDLKEAMEAVLTDIDDSASVRINYDVGVTEDKDVCLMIYLTDCSLN